MKKLPKQFSGKGQTPGYDFNQILALPLGFIYTQTSLEGNNTFEVFKRQENACKRQNLKSYTHQLITNFN